MRTYHFELILRTPTSDDDEERLFAQFEGRASAAVVGGVPLVYLHLPADSMDDALRMAIGGAREVGLSVRRIELDPDTFLADAA